MTFIWRRSIALMLLSGGVASAIQIKDNSPQMGRLIARRGLRAADPLYLRRSFKLAIIARPPA